MALLLKGDVVLDPQNNSVAQPKADVTQQTVSERAIISRVTHSYDKGMEMYIEQLLRLKIAQT